MSLKKQKKLANGDRVEEDFILRETGAESCLVSRNPSCVSYALTVRVKQEWSNII